MLFVLSPAKNLDFESTHPAVAATKPAFLKDAAVLAETAAALSVSRIGKLMGVSAKLAELTRARFNDYRADGKAPLARPAVFAFNGDVYLGLDAYTLGADDLHWAQDRLRILSGLYGVLRPFDLVQPYRLEMGLRLANPRGASLYEFWGDRIARELGKATSSHADRAIVNLASDEYFSAVDRNALKSPVIGVAFREEKDGRLRTLQFFAKRARGMMARWIIRNRVDTAALLTNFDEGGYRVRRDLSSADQLVFVRPQPPLKTVAKA